MSSVYLPEDVLIRRAVDALFEELGAVEAARFLSLARSYPPDSVEWHRRWQQGLNVNEFFDAVFREQTTTDDRNAAGG